jgi:hypothetical protein
VSKYDNPSDDQLIVNLLVGGAEMGLLMAACLREGMSPNRTLAVVREKYVGTTAFAAAERIFALAVEYQKRQN